MASRAEQRAIADEKAAEVSRAEADFVAKKAAGQAKRDKALARAFTAAKTFTEYDKARRDTAPAVSPEDKAELRKVRQEYRDNYRGPPKDGGASPATIEAGSGVG